MSRYYLVLGALAIIASFGVFVSRRLARTPRPNAVPGRQHLHFLSEITTFAFTLCLVALMLFITVPVIAAFISQARTAAEGEIAKEEAKKLTIERDALRKQLAALSELQLRQRSSAVEILFTEVTADYTEWHELGADEINLKGRCWLKLSTKRTLWRAVEEFKIFTTTFGADMPPTLTPTFHSSTHELTAKLNTDPIPPGGKAGLRRWILQYDLAHSPLYKPFDVITEIMVPNSNQPKAGSPWRPQEGSLILYPTRNLRINVVTRTDRPIDTRQIRCVRFPTGPATEETLENPDLRVSAEGTHLTWNIAHPNLGFHYVVHWEWVQPRASAHNP